MRRRNKPPPLPLSRPPRSLRESTLRRVLSAGGRDGVGEEELVQPSSARDAALQAADKARIHLLLDPYELRVLAEAGLDELEEGLGTGGKDGGKGKGKEHVELGKGGVSRTTKGKGKGKKAMKGKGKKIEPETEVGEEKSVQGGYELVEGRDLSDEVQHIVQKAEETVVEASEDVEAESGDEEVRELVEAMYGHGKRVYKSPYGPPPVDVYPTAGAGSGYGNSRDIATNTMEGEKVYKSPYGPVPYPVFKRET